MLVAIERKFKERAYAAAQARAVLSYDTESVPVQQFQARCADLLLFAPNLQLSKARSRALPVRPAPCSKMNTCDVCHVYPLHHGQTQRTASMLVASLSPKQNSKKAVVQAWQTCVCV